MSPYSKQEAARRFSLARRRFMRLMQRRLGYAATEDDWQEFLRRCARHTHTRDGRAAAAAYIEWLKTARRGWIPKWDEIDWERVLYVLWEIAKVVIPLLVLLIL